MTLFDIAAFLRTRSPRFADFTDLQLKDLVEGSRFTAFVPNEAIIEFGVEGRFLGVLLDGETEASVTDDSGEKRLLGKGTPGVTLEGARGSVTLDHGVICALRHIHMSPEDALRFGLQDKSMVHVRVHGGRELTFGDVLVRVDPNFRLAMHIDTDEANAAGIATGVFGMIVDSYARG